MNRITAGRLPADTPTPALLRVELARAAATSPAASEDFAETLRAVDELTAAGAELRAIVFEIWHAAFVAGYLDGLEGEVRRTARIAAIHGRAQLGQVA